MVLLQKKCKTCNDTWNNGKDTLMTTYEIMAKLHCMKIHLYDQSEDPQNCLLFFINCGNRLIYHNILFVGLFKLLIYVISYLFLFNIKGLDMILSNLVGSGASFVFYSNIHSCEGVS